MDDDEFDEEEDYDEESGDGNDETKKENHKEVLIKKEENIGLKDEDINSNLYNFSNEIVEMKKYDENGILIDGYDYYQHIAKDVPIGELVCSLEA